MRITVTGLVLWGMALGAGGGEPQPPDALAAARIFERARRSTVTVHYVQKSGDRRERGRAMGIVISSGGLVLTHGDIKRSSATLERIYVLLGERR